MATQGVLLEPSDISLAKFGKLLDELRHEYEHIQALVRVLDSDKSRLQKPCQKWSLPPSNDAFVRDRSSSDQEFEAVGQEWAAKPPPAPPSLPSARNGKHFLGDKDACLVDESPGGNGKRLQGNQDVPLVDSSPGGNGKHPLGDQDVRLVDEPPDGNGKHFLDNQDVRLVDESPKSNQNALVARPKARSSKATPILKTNMSLQSSFSNTHGHNDEKHIRASKVSVVAHQLARIPTVSLQPSEPNKTEHFDLVMCLIILANSLVMTVGLEWSGHKAAVDLGLKPPSDAWEHAEITFTTLNFCFSIVFTLEFAYRVWTQGRKYFSVISNNFDAGLVVVNIIDIIAENSKGEWNVFRSLRVLKIARMLRICRIMHLLTALRIVVATMSSAVGACIWPISVLFLFVILCGVLICSIMEGVIGDESLDTDVRIWSYNYYGSSSRAIYTMFEATFSGCWPNYARRMIEEINPLYAFFWLPYVTVVVFAIVRIIAALFIKDIMAKASADAEVVKFEKEKKKEQYLGQIEDSFRAMDISGDGLLCREEMMEVMTDPDVIANLEAMDLTDIFDHDIFGMLDNGDGHLTCDEYMKGVMRMRGPARSVDVHVMLFEGRRLKKAVDQLATSFNRFKGDGGPVHGAVPDVVVCI